MSNILEIHDLVVSYGGIEAVKGIDLTVEESKIVTLIGSNGAGKSTTLKAVAGLVRPKSGEILLDGTNLVGKSTDQIVSSGVTLVPEGRRVFSNLTVAENLRIAHTCARTRSRTILPACTICSRASRSANGSRPGRSRAASSRCWPSAGR